MSAQAVVRSFRALHGGYLFARCGVLGIGLGDLLACDSPQAFVRLLTRKYHQAIFACHPDTHQHTQTQFRRVTAAYQLLQATGWRQWRRRITPSLPSDLPLPWARGWGAGTSMSHLLLLLVLLVPLLLVPVQNHAYIDGNTGQDMGGGVDDGYPGSGGDLEGDSVVGGGEHDSSPDAVDSGAPGDDGMSDEGGDGGESDDGGSDSGEGSD